MSWFGFGGNKKEEPTPSYSSSYDEPTPFQDTTNFASPSTSYSPSVGSSSQSSFVAELQQEQQKLMVQGVVMKLTAMAFDSCVNKPSSSLSSSEQSCIAAVTGKYMDTTEFIVAKMYNQQH